MDAAAAVIRKVIKCLEDVFDAQRIASSQRRRKMFTEHGGDGQFAARTRRVAPAVDFRFTGPDPDQDKVLESRSRRIRHDDIDACDFQIARRSPQCVGEVERCQPACQNRANKPATINGCIWLHSAPRMSGRKSVMWESSISVINLPVFHLRPPTLRSSQGLCPRVQRDPVGRNVAVLGGRRSPVDSCFPGRRRLPPMNESCLSDELI